MLGGSAPTQTPGAPFRTGSGSRATVWPPPAHQTDLFNRSFGIYSLFPGPGDAPKTLYTPAAKTGVPSNSFQDFVGTEKVPDAFFPTKFSFGTNGTPSFNSSSRPGEISRLELTSKTFTLGTNPYSSTGKKSEDQDINARKESRSKRLSDDVVIIKSEVEEVNKDRRNSKREKAGNDEEENCSGGRKFKEGKNISCPGDNESTIIRVEGVLPNEPDSTESQISNNQRPGDFTTSRGDFCKANTTKQPNCNKKLETESLECGVNKEKCNIKVIDLNADGTGKCSSKKKAEKGSVKMESINEICNRLTEKKNIKTKTPDSSCKSLAPTCKKLNEAKLSPTRTLSLPPHSGGCSRTTPVTFKHSSQPDTEPKPQSLNLEVPPLVIKKEPPDFQKYPMGTSFLSPNPLDNFFSPGGLRDLDTQLLSPVPYSDTFESSNRRKDNFISPNVDHNFLSPSQGFLSPRPIPENPFLSPNVDMGEFGAFKNYRTLPKLGDDYLISGNVQKIPEEVYLGRPGCLPSENDRTHSSGFATSVENESKNKPAENNVSNGANVTPCQVAEVTSATSLLSPKLQPVNPLVVKQETTSLASGSGIGPVSTDPKQEVTFIPSGQSTTVSSTVGAVVARQRCQQRVSDMKMPSNSVPPTPVIHRTVQSPASIDISPAMGAAVYSGGIGCEDRAGNLITTWPAQAHNPTLWQYSAPIDYPPFPPVGFQLVRDPITGHFLLIPASNIEALQRAILWPSYQPTPPQMIIPPISVQPSTPHLLLDTNVPAVDFLTPETIHHNAQQHRILATADNGPKRKMSTPTLIKLEASECSNAVVVASCGNNNIYAKTHSSSLTPGNEALFYSQRPSIAIENGRRSQATSPAPCLTTTLNQASSNDSIDNQSESFQPQITTTVTLQDASNQTDMLLETEIEATPICRDKFEPYTKTTELNIKMPKTQDVSTETLSRELEDDKETVMREIQKRKDVEKSLKIQISNVPDVNIKKEIISPLQVDLSGLELLSNSIEQFVCETKNKKVEESKESMRNLIEGEKKDLSNDACEGAVLLQNLKNGFREVDTEEMYESDCSKNLGGLGLLCALAEQRFQEEIGEESLREDIASKEEDLLEEPEEEHVDMENEKNENEEDEGAKFMEKNEFKFFNKKESEDCDLNRNYQSENSDRSKKQMKAVDDVPDESNLKQIKALHCKEVNKTKKDFSCEISHTNQADGNNLTKRGPGRPKKIKTSETLDATISSVRDSRRSKEMSPPVLEKVTDLAYPNEVLDSVKIKSKIDISKPPTLIPSTSLSVTCKTTENFDLPSCQVSLVAIKVSSDLLKKREDLDIEEEETKKRKLLETNNHVSSSKKRKVGRPKKHHLLHENTLTETIVAKKPKTKPIYLYQSIHSESSNCLKTKTTEVMSEKSSGEKRKISFVKLETEVMDVCHSPENEDKKPRKIRPKLKAEPKMREWSPLQDDDSEDWKSNIRKEENCKQNFKFQRKVAIDGEKVNEYSRMNGMKESNLPSCVLTTEHLNSDKFPIRTLTVMGGLFYAGQLSAIRAPDVYGITIDGERGNRPHIYSREEILKDSILELKPEKTSDLTPGTRCCAYWSEQYRCLYPGTVSVPTSPNPELDEKFVNVEFDDGDSGRINIDDIRLLPEDYPVIEYDPNPLQSLSKRKRRISGASVESQSKERKSVDSVLSSEKNETVNENIPKVESINEETEPEKIIQMFEAGPFLTLESERRHLKKKRREKLKRLQSLSIDGKKKHKKHKCSDEHRHHRHHKKHRKHKHKHGKRHCSELNGESKSQDEISGEGSKREEVSRKKNKNKCKSSERVCKISDKSKTIKPKKCKERTDSVESRSKMAAFLPARQLWGWSGKGFRRPGAKGRARKEFYKTIQRGKERITVGDCAVFLSTGRPDRPYIGRIESMWESWGTNMIVRVKWFYHPEETVGCPATLEYPGALFESPHVDENDVQTISHKCEVLPLKDYTAKIGDEPHRYETIYDNNDIYYLAGYYDPTNTTLKMEPGVK